MRFGPTNALRAGALALCLGISADAQDPPGPPAASPPGAEEPVADRLRRMEAMLDKVMKQNEALSRENREISRRYDDLARKVDTSSRPAPGNSPAGGGTAGAGPGPDGDSGQDANQAGGGSSSSGGDPTTTGRAQGVGNRHVGKIPVTSLYDWDNDGFRFSAQDGEYTLGVRAMSQIDARDYQQKYLGPVSGGFANPRTRIYFEGQFTRPISYEFSFQNFFDTVQLLDAYLNFNYDSRFQLRIGRYKSPFSYEWYRIHVWDLLAPERSLFANNFEGNRRFGLMGWGVLFDNRLEYAVGTFDSQRNSFQPFNNRQDVMAFLNAKPFVNDEGSWLRDLQVGGSVDAGNENQPVVPAALRTNLSPSGAGVGATGGANTSSLPFLAFNSNVIERGNRALGELHAAYYKGGLSLIGAWQGGIESYARTGADTATPTRVPIGGFFVQGGYLLTGETLRDRTLIDPLRPFDLRPGRFGLGAVEVTARYSELNLGQQVFSAGLADPNIWTRSVQMTDVGFNWYLNKFVKLYFDWEHSLFGQPIAIDPRNPQKQNDLFWLRMQVYF